MKATIQRIQQQSSFTPNGQLQQTYIVSFMVGEHGPFTITFAQADFTVEKVNQALAQFAATVNGLTAA